MYAASSSPNLKQGQGLVVPGQPEASGKGLFSITWKEGNCLEGYNIESIHWGAASPQGRASLQSVHWRQLYPQGSGQQGWGSTITPASGLAYAPSFLHCPLPHSQGPALTPALPTLPRSFRAGSWQCQVSLLVKNKVSNVHFIFCCNLNPYI